MDCLEFRRRRAAEPQSRDPELLAHRDSCAACTAAWERAQVFERELLAALEVPVPAGLAAHQQARLVRLDGDQLAG